MTATRAVVSWSSGKDSAYAVHVLRQQPDLELVGVLTTVTDEYGRVSMHGVRESVLDRQIVELGLPCRKIRIPRACTNEIYEQRMAEVLKDCLSAGIEQVVFGDLFLRDIRAYRERNLARLGMRGIFPLWERDTAVLAREMVEAGLRAVITCVDPRVLPRTFAGRVYDHRFLDDLPPGIDPCGENGEFHSVTIAGPMLRKRLPVRVGDIVDRDDFVFADVHLM
ncbi:MAG TPA: hypothetical protein VML75_21335 [Kofleriaceae bacterium]|nr:hypothetical protein [Kofleriaceae bacterium]